eukprot:1245423-Pyramimonas_sp.AAC.1
MSAAVDVAKNNRQPVVCQVPYFSGRTGARLMEVDGQHLLSLWRDPVRFEDAINSLADEYKASGSGPLQFVEVGSYVGLAYYARIACEGRAGVELGNDVSCFSPTGKCQLADAEQALRKKASPVSSETIVPQALSLDSTIAFPDGVKLYVFSGVSPR